MNRTLQHRRPLLLQPSNELVKSIMQPGLVSIMMPAYNAADYIAEAIESILAQRYQNWELIIVDDGSTDQTSAIASSYGDARIKLFHQPNQGESAARNRALAQMQGEYVAFLDADDLFQPRHLSAAVSYLQHHPEHQGVYTDGYYCDQQGMPEFPLSSRRRGPFRNWIFEELVRASDVFGPPVCVVLRYDAILQHQLRFDTLIVIGPDWDFFVRYAQVAQFGYIDQQTCLYRVHQTNITVRTDQQKRAKSLARCREKAIKLQNFPTCSLDIQIAVFYDLLVNLLRGCYQRQDEVSNWSEFTALPKNEQSRLLRIMASKNMVDQHRQPDEERDYIAMWLARSHWLNPHCTRSRLLYMLYKLSPTICKLGMHMKQLLHPDASYQSPFGKLV